MGIEDIKRWHWILIGLVVGLALGYARVETGKDAPPRGQRGFVSPWEFERGLHERPVEGNPRVRDITFYKRGDAYVVDMELLVEKNETTWEYEDRELYTRVLPYQPSIPAQGLPDGWVPWRTGNRTLPPSPKGYTVVNYLQDVAKHNPKVTFVRAWWKEPNATMAWWTLGSVALIGGVWPTVVNLLIGAGFGRPKKEEPEYDLDRFKSEPEAAKPTGPSAEDDAKVRSHLEELEHEVEANLSGAGTSSDDAGAGATSTAGGVRTLTGGPLEIETAAGPAKPRDYKGEYYPVARPKTGGGHDDPHGPSRV